MATDAAMNAAERQGGVAGRSARCSTGRSSSPRGRPLLPSSSSVGNSRFRRRNSQAAAMPSSNDVSAAKPSSRSARPASRTLRCSSPSRGGSNTGSMSTPEARRQASKSSSTDVATPVPTLKTPVGRSSARHRHRRDVAHVDVVALLGAVAEDVRRLPAGQEAEEDGDDAGLAVRILTGPEHVAVAKRRVPGSVEPVVRGQVLLARKLRRPVLGEGLARRRLGGRLGALSVDGAAGRGEDDAGPVLARRLEEPDRPEHVHLAVEVGARDRHAHVGLRGQVQAGLRAGLAEDLLDGLPVADVGDDQLGARIDVLRLAVGEIVEDDDLVAAGDKRVDDVRADEARAPCDDRPHVRILRRSHVRDLRRSGRLREVDAGPAAGGAASVGGPRGRAHPRARRDRGSASRSARSCSTRKAWPPGPRHRSSRPPAPSSSTR